MSNDMYTSTISISTEYCGLCGIWYNKDQRHDCVMSLNYDIDKKQELIIRLLQEILIELRKR